MDIPLPAAVIEKDFWVCWTLKTLNEIPELKGNITFKGGTSLSKAWGLIERFSKEIDIAINRKVFGQEPPHGAEDAESNRQRKIRLEELEQKSASFIKEFLLPQLQEKVAEHVHEKFELRLVQKGNEVNIEFEYPGTLKNELGGLLPVVLIELVPRADEMPNEERTITPIIHEVYADLLGEGSFSVSTLAPERTFLEKLLFIHETLEGFNKGSERKSRHYYDLLKLYQAGVFDKIKSNPELLKIVVEHRQTFFRYNTMNYDAILISGVRTLPAAENWSDWRGDYNRSAVMIYNNPLEKPRFIRGFFFYLRDMNYFSIALSGLLFFLTQTYDLNAQANCSSSDGYACVVIPNKDAGKIQMFYKDPTGNRFWNIWNVKQHIEKQGKHLVFAMNGGMYTPLYKPVGLYIDEGKSISPINLKNGDNNFCWKPNGVFAIDKNGKAQVTISEKFNSANIRFATQSGPMILIDGKMHDGFENSQSKYIRNAVGVKSNGDVFFCISLKGVTFQELSDYMLKNGCINALYFDGSVSEMYCPQNKQWDCGSSFGVIVGYVE